ncbi:putative ABC transport system permease protein [Allocatelliglobosispora scoriae]|uniref:Putative ABC transport system permease protein n=1 Tax=Allocatelliglobosispora scoriae TaxID=643052 RepID=A0A841C4U1_9ACTN|nr:ABC transporter permease [Allocatelliglobosispora scoriae]MBB5873841.1 putative ABC transport system permease protein [Allocatelliglobosispora scoriae]
MLRATLKSLLARKLRLTLSALAVVLGVMFVSGSFVLTDTLSRSFDDLFRGIYSTVDVQVGAAGQSAGGPDDEEGGMVGQRSIPMSTLAEVTSVPGVAKAVGEVGADGARVIGSDGKVVNSFGPPRIGESWTGENELVKLREGRGPTADNEIAVNADLAAKAGIKVGDQVGVLTREPKQVFTLVGIYGYSGGRDTLGGSQSVSFTEPVAQKLMLGEQGVYTSITVTAADGTTPAALRDAIAAKLGPKYSVKTGEELGAEAAAAFASVLDIFNNVLLGFAGVALFVGTFLILNTFSIVVAQRTKELALMRAVGASRRQMIGSVLTEAVAIGLIASVLGLAAGFGVGRLMAYLFGEYGADGLELAGVNLPLSAVISSFAVGLVVTMAAAVMPALRASRIPPMAALQEVATPDRPLTKISIAGAVVMAAGGTVLGIGFAGKFGDDTLWAVLGGALATFLGVALLTPLISRPVVAALGRLTGTWLPGKLGRRNAGRNPRRTGITAAALMIGVALVTSVGVVLESATVSFTKTTEDTVHAQLYIGGDQNGPLPPTFDAAVLEKAKTVPGIGQVLGVWYGGGEVDGEREGLAAISDVAALKTVFDLAVTEGSLDALGEKQAFVDDRTATAAGVHVGSPITVVTTRGEPVTYTVAGVYTATEYVNGYLLPSAARSSFDTAQPREAYLTLLPGATVAQTLPLVKQLLVDSPEVTAVDRAGMIQQETGDIGTMLSMVQILLSLAILIAALGIMNTLALSVLERTRELGLLRAVGLSRLQSTGMITAEAVLISVFGALLGMGVGIGLGAAAVRAFKDDGFSTFALPWDQLGVYVGLAAVIGVIAGVVPSIRAARINVLGAIAHD